MNLELEQTLLEMAEQQDALLQTIKKLEKKINKLEESNKLLNTKTENNIFYICENTEELDNTKECLVKNNQEIFDIERKVDILESRLINLESDESVINDINQLHSRLVSLESDDTSQYVRDKTLRLSRIIEIIDNRLDTYIKIIDKHLEIDNGLGIIPRLQTQIEELEKKNTIIAKEGDIVYFVPYGESYKFKVVSVIGDALLLKFNDWWLPRLLGNDRYITVPKNAIYYKDKKNYIIK